MGVSRWPIKVLLGIELSRPFVDGGPEGQDLARDTGLDDAARIHDRRPVGDIGHNAEIVTDEDHSHAGLGLKVREKVHDLLLHGHVQGSRRLVADQQLGFSAMAIAIMMR